jgi:hypothetical protein
LIAARRSRRLLRGIAERLGISQRRGTAAKLVTAFGLVVGLVLGSALSANAANDVGNDVSYPQCGVTLPVSSAFAIVGVTGGLTNNDNPCLASQLDWSTSGAITGSVEQPPTAYYVNTGNPALKASWWPTSNRTKAGTIVHNPHGTCAHTSSSSCAYVYGYSAAEADASRAGVVNPATSLWWLDVETSNTWQKKTSANAASIAGMVAYFRSIGATVGIYSTAYQWKKIAGTTSTRSTLAKLRSWLAGASSQTDATKRCSASAPLTPGGHVSIVQYVDGALDFDISCRTFGSAPRPTISGTPANHKKLTATAGAWPDGATLTYRWKRSGVAISGASHSTYTTRPADVGKSITVTVTGRLTGYNTGSKSSAKLTILKSP